MSKCLFSITYVKLPWDQDAQAQTCQLCRQDVQMLTCKPYKVWCQICRYMSWLSKVGIVHAICRFPGLAVQKCLCVCSPNKPRSLCMTYLAGREYQRPELLLLLTQWLLLVAHCDERSWTGVQPLLGCRGGLMGLIWLRGLVSALKCSHQNLQR